VKVTRDQMEFVETCLSTADPAEDGCVYVDVTRISERYSIPYQSALKIMRHCVKAMGHRVVRRNLVEVSEEERAAKPTKVEMALAAIREVISRDRKKIIETEEKSTLQTKI
jgi:hypothetical protein